MASKDTMWKFDTLAEMEAKVGFGSGVKHNDIATVVDHNLFRYDEIQEKWLGADSLDWTLTTADGILVSTFIGVQGLNNTVQQYEVWFSSVQSFGTNWAFRRVSFTAFRNFAGTVAISPLVDVVPATSDGNGSTLVYGISHVPNWTFADITANAGENWAHSILVFSTTAGDRN